MPKNRRILSDQCEKYRPLVCLVAPSEINYVKNMHFLSANYWHDEEIVIEYFNNKSGMPSLLHIWICFLPQNADSVVNIAKVRASRSAFGAPRRFPWYKSAWYSRLNVPKYRQGEQYPFASCNRFLQKDVVNYAETLFLSGRLQVYITFS